jgi:hypothetical protein
MIENGLILTGSDAELLSRALTVVKSKAYEESEGSLDNSQALETLVSYFKKEGYEKETGRLESRNPSLHKKLFLGTVIARQGGLDNYKS